jgi:hypothetical protein
MTRIIIGLIYLAISVGCLVWALGECGRYGTAPLHCFGYLGSDSRAGSNP